MFNYPGEAFFFFFVLLILPLEIVYSFLSGDFYEFPLASLFFFLKRIDDFISTFPVKGAFSLLAVSSPGEVYDQVAKNAFFLLPPLSCWFVGQGRYLGP